MQNSNSHGSIFCILPPHLLSEIAKNGTPAQRQAALNTLGHDHTTRALRLARSFQPVASIKTPMVTVRQAKVRRSIFTADHAQTLPGSILRTEGSKAVKDVAVNEAYDALGATFDFYWQEFERNSIDDQGLPLYATVHYGELFDNAYWNGQEMVFGDGDGELFNRFTCSVDVIGHELTHGVTSCEANLQYLNQSGALNESISDVFGSLIKQRGLTQTVDQADWLIGAGLLAQSVKGSALRSMKEPGSAYDDPKLGKDPQPGHMDHYLETMQDNGGVHINSGIPNHAFYLAASGIGGKAWEKAGRIWYETQRDPGLKSDATFLSFARRTLVNAGHLYGEKSLERKAVSDAWSEVGVRMARS